MPSNSAQSRTTHWTNVIGAIIVGVSTLAMISMLLVVILPENPDDINSKLAKRNESARSMNAMMYATLMFFVLAVVLSSIGNLLLNFIVTVMDPYNHHKRENVHSGSCKKNNADNFRDPDSDRLLIQNCAVQNLGKYVGQTMYKQ